jgi:pimeloyl-ACP methyl ester carboxylesterase
MSTSDLTPTVVLVHGAFVDASSWNGVIAELKAAGLGFGTSVTGTPAWKTLPSWAVVATADHAIHPNAERDMAKRAGSEITEIDASHAVLATHPADVAAVIVRAVKAIG